jgi:RNA polymerase sigma-70 factor (ECF subfamily)
MDETDKLVALARSGDRVATGRLLMLYDLRLRRHISRRITPGIQALITTEDVLQETYTEAYRHITGYQPRGHGAFYRWLATIADHKLVDSIKALRAAKRTPPKRISWARVDLSASFSTLAQLVDGKGRTPSRIVARKEAGRVLQVALASLPEPCREAVWMRHFESRSVAEIASLLGKTEHAVHQLCYRGLHLLREAMGGRSRFLSSSDE